MSASTLLGISETEYASVKAAQQKVVEILGWPAKNAAKVAAIGIMKERGKLVVSVHMNDAAPGGRPVLPKTVLDVPVRMIAGGEQRALREARDVRTADAAAPVSAHQFMMQVVRQVLNSLATKFQVKPQLGWPPYFQLTETCKVIVDSVPLPGENGPGYTIRVRAFERIGAPSYTSNVVIGPRPAASLVEQFIPRVEIDLLRFRPPIDGK